MERNYWLDTLRGFAAMWVVLHHLNLHKIINFEPNFYNSFFRVGWLGVPIFFILSGYCIGMVTQRASSPIEFMLRRFFRIYPPYYASIAVVLVVVLIRVFTFGVNDVAILPSSFSDVLATLSLMTMPATEVGTMNGVYWSLTYEVVFYIIVALTLFIKPYNKLIFLFLSVLCFIPGIYESVGKDRGPGAVEGIFFLREWLLFAAGIGLYEVSKNKSWLGALLLLLSLTGIIYTKNFLVISVSLFTLASIYLSKYPLLNNKNLVSKIGEYSYSLYLIHVPLGVYLLLPYRKGILLENLYLHILYDLITLGILVAISYGFYKIVEKPSIVFGKTLLERKFTMTKKFYPR